MINVVDLREQIIETIEDKGPILPVDVSKLVGNILFAGAVLAEMVQAKVIKQSHAKIGASPLYYLPEQAAKLEKLYKYLEPAEQQAYTLLKEKKILRDSEQNAVTRVALREIKDFAIPIEVSYSGKKELFFRWFLLNEKEINNFISRILEKEEAVKKAEPVIKAAETEAKQEEAKPAPVAKKPTAKKPKIKQDVLTTPVEPAVTAEPDDFLEVIFAFLKKNGVTVESYEIIKKNSEIELIVMLPSNLGSLRYFCKAKNKKRCSDADLSNAVIRGQGKGLPIILISPGDLAKSAEKMLLSEFKNVLYKKVS